MIAIFWSLQETYEDTLYMCINMGRSRLDLFSLCLYLVSPDNTWCRLSRGVITWIGAAASSTLSASAIMDIITIITILYFDYRHSSYYCSSLSTWPLPFSSHLHLHLNYGSNYNSTCLYSFAQSQSQPSSTSPRERDSSSEALAPMALSPSPFPPPSSSRTSSFQLSQSLLF